MLTKICGMRGQDDLAHANKMGFDICGFIFHPPSPRYVPPEIASRLESFAMRRAGVFITDNPVEIRATMTMARLDFAQLHGNQSIQCARDIGPERVIRVLWPARFASIDELEDEAEKHAGASAFFLLDAGASGGGSGSVLSWGKLASLALPRPWFLAGGLSPENIRIALKQCHPDGLDFNSGLEDSPGRKNKIKMSQLAQILQMKSEQEL